MTAPARELPPQAERQGRLALADQEVRDEEGQADRDDRGQPDQDGERVLEVHLVGVGELAAREGLVDEVAADRGEDHDDAHREDPDQQDGLRPLAHVADEAVGQDRGDARDVWQRDEDEGDERDAGDAVGLEAIGGRADRVAGVVTGAVGDDAGVAGVVFLDVEDDLHQVRADVGDLGEDAAGDTERRGAERLADREADEARAGVVGGHEQEDHQHQQQLGRDQHGADAHAGLERDGVGVERLAAQRREGRARVGEAVDPDAEERDQHAAEDADHREQGDRGDLGQRDVLEHAEVRDDDRRDRQPEVGDELRLGPQVGLARGVDQLGDLEHRLVDRQVLELLVLEQAEQQAERTDHEAEGEDVPPVHPQELHLVKVGQDEAGLGVRAGGLLGGAGRHRGGTGGSHHGEPAEYGRHGNHLGGGRKEAALYGRPPASARPQLPVCRKVC
jgi:hypothetical protein